MLRRRVSPTACLAVSQLGRVITRHAKQSRSVIVQRRIQILVWTWRACMQLHNSEVALFTGGCVEKRFGRKYGKIVGHQGECGPLVAW